MANKIRDIFSDDMFGMEGKMRFKDKEAYNSFLSMLDKVYDEGRSIKVEGVASISTTINQNGIKFPLDDSPMPSYVFITPAIESFSIPLLINGEEKELSFFRTNSRQTITVKTKEDAVISFQFVFSKGENKQTVKYVEHLEKATTIKDVIESYQIAEALFEKLFIDIEHPSGKKDALTIYEIKQYFHNQAKFYQRLLAIEAEFSLSISTSTLKALTAEEQHDIDEIYLLIIDQRIVRSSKKYTYDESTSLVLNKKTTDLDIGDGFDLTYLGMIEYSFLGQTIQLYTANLFTNLIVREIRTESDNTTRVLFGDTDSKPMYVSYSAFRTKEAASEERDMIIKHAKDYINAKYSNAYFTEYYSK